MMHRTTLSLTRGVGSIFAEQQRQLILASLSPSTSSFLLDSLPSRRRQTYASASPNAPPPNPHTAGPYIIFDREAKRMQKDRAARGRREPGEHLNLATTVEGKKEEEERRKERSRVTDYVREEVASNVVERLLDIKRSFPTIVDLGSGAGHFLRNLDVEATGTEKVIMCDLSEDALNRDKDLDEGDVLVERRVVDEENLPFQENSLDCIVSALSLHWTNDLPGALVQIQRALKPDGVFIGAIFGGDTLFELRTSLQLAEQEREGGISPRVSPMTESRDMASLLSRAGFTIPTVDVDEMTIGYPSMFELIEDLQAMGESNAVINRRTHLSRDTLLAASAIYKELHGLEDGSVPATFSVIYVIGWKPAPGQAKPLPRGSAQKSMKEALGGEGGGGPGGQNH